MPETQSDLGVIGSQTWWDVRTLSTNRSLRLKHNTKSDVKRGDTEVVSNSVTNLADDNSDDRRSLFGSISKAVGRVRARLSDAAFSPPSSPYSSNSTSSAQPPSATAEPTATTASPPLTLFHPKDSQGQEVKVQGDGRGTKRGIFKRLKNNVGSRSGETVDRTARRRSEGDNQTGAISAPRYTRVYEEMNRLTSDFRQATVDNPLP